MSAKNLLIAAILIGGCATPPRPNELEAFERLKQSPNYQAAQRRVPDMVAESERLFGKANEEWQSNDLDLSRRDALMGSIKLKTALALVEYDQSKARADKAQADLRGVEDEYSRVNKDLVATQEQIALLQKLKETSSQAAMQQEKMKQELATREAAGSARDKIAAAELALKGAEQVNAQEFAKVEYQAASDTLKRAQAQLEAKDYQMASQNADAARDQANRATQTAKPTYEQTSSNTASQARNEALAKDLAGIPGAQVRLERRGDVQRAAVPLRGLFARKSTVITAGNEGVLDQLAAVMKKYPMYNTMVVGYTDNRGRRDELLARSQAQATAVYSALVGRGVEAKRMVVSGNGADEPVSDNRTTAGRALNNRVEVIFLYQ
ncbi:MAG TPA: OmpA family protein [Polyangia bacterium]|jgi:outer membrane protein OmpA-like peptidoglycan-associated protein